MYYKWLIDENGERVEDIVADAALEHPTNPEEELRKRKWTFVPIAEFPTLQDAVDLLKAECEFRSY